MGKLKYNPKTNSFGYPDLSPWERIEAIVKHYGFASVQAMALHVGLNGTGELYRIKNENGSIDATLAGTIRSALPNLNPEWIVSGSGNMLK